MSSYNILPNSRLVLRNKNGEKVIQPHSGLIGKGIAINIRFIKKAPLHIKSGRETIIKIIRQNRFLSMGICTHESQQQDTDNNKPFHTQTVTRHKFFVK